MENDTPIELKDLKDCLESLEKLKAIRRELKAKLNREDLSDDGEVQFAENLRCISKQISTLEDFKLRELKIAGANKQRGKK